MRWLYRYSSRDYLSREQQDTIEAVFEYGQFFPEDVMERLRKDGLTGQVHCLVSQAVAYAASNRRSFRERIFSASSKGVPR